MILEVNNLNKKLDEFKLTNISLALPPGYIMGLIGPNGAGKTTLINSILGLYHADSGQIRIGGMTYEENESAIRQMTGVVLVDELFEGGWSLERNAVSYGVYYKEFNLQTLRGYIKRFGLEEKKKFGSLSKGEKLKFQLAFALSHNSKLLVMDEPAGNFDPEFRKEFFKVLKEYIADGDRSVIIATHITDDLDRMADYIVYIDSGDSIFAGDVEELRQRYRILTGEKYKINLLDKSAVIYAESGECGTRALVKHGKRTIYDESLAVTVPTIEELMYFITKGKGGR